MPSRSTDETAVMLEAARQFCPAAVFVFTSTNKVYGDTPNRLPLVELDTRWEIDPNHPWIHGIPEEMSIDHTLHSLFGASKVAADVLVQEYGRYFSMKTACFRGGCLTGPNHSGTQLHGFLAFFKMPHPQAADSRFFRQLALRPATPLPLVPDQFSKRADCFDSHRSLDTNACVRMH